ncbi:MAG: SAM-dependent chlorinase/fluorinase [Candidatus Omnitrophota bacterium]
MFITLLTDFGLSDNFAGVVKGVIYAINPKVKIIDICHNIRPGDIFQAAFLLKSSYQYFPPGTIHLVVVDPGVGSKRRIIIAKTKRYYFIGPDNGVLSLALGTGDQVSNIVCLDNQNFFLKPVSHTFHGRDIFAPVAAYLSRGIDLVKFGRPQKKYREINFPQPRIISQAGKNRKALEGEIIYIDRFGNLITNISREAFEIFIAKKKFRISLGKKAINRISKNYLATGKNKPLAIFGSYGNLEISVSCGNASDYFGASKQAKLRVTA